MKEPVPVAANEFVSHGKKEKSKARPSKSGKVGHPGTRGLGKCKSQYPVDNVQEWYYVTVMKCQLEQMKKKVHENHAARPFPDCPR
jgi:hypothetical protein